MKITAVFFNRQKKDIFDRSNILNNMDNIIKTKRKNKFKDNYIDFNKSITNDKSGYINRNNNSNSNSNSYNNIFSILNIFKNINLKEIIIFTILLFVIINVFSNFSLGIKSDILNLASNIHESNNLKISYDYVKNIYPVFNDTSYILKDTISNIDVADNKDINNNVKDNDNDNDKSSDNINDKKDIKFKSITDIINTPDVFNSIENPTVSEKQMSNRKVVNINNIILNNYSKHLNIDFKEFVNKKLYFTKASDKLLFYHTHTSESYANSEKYKFGYSSTYRSRDEKFNMLSVGKLLNELLESKKVNSIHNTKQHDYYTYTTSYTNSRNTLKTELSKDSYSVIFDLHRDALADLTYAPTTNIEGKEVAQLMFVVGVGSKAYPNKYYKENLALAIKFQLLAESIYPGLFKPMMIKDYTYNQDMNKHSLLIECRSNR